MPYSSVQSFVGVAKEATRGTAAVPVDFIPVKTMQLVDHQEYLEDKDIRGSQVDNYGQIQGVSWAEYDLAGDVFADTIGYPLAGVLGDVTVTGGAAPYTHAMAVKNSGDGQPISYTITDFDGLQARALTAGQFSECNFTFAADGLLEYAAKLSGNISATAATPTRSYTPVAPYANWQGAVTIGGTVTTTLIQGTCDIKRPVSPIHTVDGTANPYRFWAGAVNVSGKLTLVTETSETFLVDYLTNVQPSLDLNFTQGAGAGLTQVKLHMTKAAFVTGQITRGKDWIETEVTYKAVANTTDVGASAGYGVIVATLQNAKAAGTFA